MSKPFNQPANMLAELLVREESARKALAAGTSEDAPRAPRAWEDLPFYLTGALRDKDNPEFKKRMTAICAEICTKTAASPDGALLTLFYLSQDNYEFYSATHSILAAVVACIVAKDVLRWNDKDCARIALVALAMNVSMLAEQDVLAKQGSAPTEAQKKVIAEHAKKSAEIMKARGFDDQDILTAIESHHTAGDAEFKSGKPGLVMAAVVRAADIYTAKRSPRAARPAASETDAIKTVFSAQGGGTSQVGQAVIKAVGVFSPGSFVRLAGQETAIVIKRSEVSSSPYIALLTDSHGIALASPQVVRVDGKQVAIAERLPKSRIKIQPDIKRLSNLRI